MDLFQTSADTQEDREEAGTDEEKNSLGGDNMSRRRGIGSHQSIKMINDEWLTPPDIIEDLGPFDLDPCAPVVRPWDTAEKHFTINDNGLLQVWFGFVWCNPPYGALTGVWLDRMALHNNGIALVFARTEIDMFFRSVWNKATSILFIKGRLHFYYVTGERAKANSGAPSVLVAYGKFADYKLKTCAIPGKYINLKSNLCQT